MHMHVKLCRTIFVSSKVKNDTIEIKSKKGVRGNLNNVSILCTFKQIHQMNIIKSAGQIL